jgi:hypothetical protein
MLGRSHRIWKYGSIIGATVIVPTIYLIFNEGKAESLPFACWVVIGFAVGWDLARMIAGKTRSRGKRRSLPRRGLPNARGNRVGVTNDWFDEDLEAAQSMMDELRRGPELQIHMNKGMVCRCSFDYDGSAGPIHVDQS